MKIVRQDTINKVDSNREVHHLSARKELKEEYTRREKILRSDEQSASGGGKFRPLDRLQDVGAMRKECKDYKRNYERGAPIKLPPSVRNQLWKKAKLLKDEFVVGMVSKKDMHPVKHVQLNGSVAVVADYDALQSTRSVERNKVWTKVNQKKVGEFKRIMRMLEPDNPNIANIERFRREK